MANLIGSGADQVSTNGMLGTAAFVDAERFVSSTNPTVTGLMDVTGNITSGGAVVDVASGLRPSLSVDWTQKPTAAALTAAGWTIARTGEITSFGLPTKAAENLFVRSADFANASWTKALATVSAVTDESGLAGSALVATAVGGFHSAYAAIINTNIGSANYRVRFLCKAGAYTKCLIADGSSSRAAAAFDLAAGATIASTFGAGYVSHSITAHEFGGGLYWCELVMTSSPAGSGWAISLGGYPDSGATLSGYGASYTGDGVSGIEVYAAQLQQGFDGDYIPTTDAPITLYEPQLVTTAANELAYQHNASGECTGLVQYPADTNLVLQSQDLGNASWVKTNVAVTSTKRKWAGSVPFWRVSKPNTTGSARANQDVTTSVLAGAKYTATVAVLADMWSATSSVGVGLMGTANGQWGASGDSVGVILSGPGSIAQFDGGLFNVTGLSTTVPTLVRVTRTYPLAETSLSVRIYPGTSASTTIGAAILATRVHLSASPRLMPYIPTTTAAVTRGAQSITLTGSAFTAVNNPQQGTLLAKASVEDLVWDVTRTTVAVTTANTANLAYIGNSSTTALPTYVVQQFGVTQKQATSATAWGTAPMTTAFGYAQNSFQGGGAGALSTLDTAGNVPALDRLSHGTWTGLIQRTELYPRAMTSAELAAITTPGALEERDLSDASLKQDKLVSGTNIKTVNGTSLLGSGNMSVGGALVLLATITPTASANIDALNVFNSTYDDYLIVGNGIGFAADNAPSIQLAVAGSVDSGSNYVAVHVENVNSSTTATSTQLTGASTVRSAGKGCNFRMQVSNANATTGHKFLLGSALWNDDTGTSYVWTNRYVAYIAANAVTGFRLFTALGGNFAAQGSIKVYGIAKV